MLGWGRDASQRRHGDNPTQVPVTRLPPIKLVLERTFPVWCLICTEVPRVRLRLAFILPLLQFLLAISLLHWGNRIEVETMRRMRYDTPYMSTPALICTGINAPARLLEAISFFFRRVDHAPPKIFGLGLDDVLFFVGIIALWFLVGYILDKRRSSGGSQSVWSIGKLLLAGVPLSVMGALFLYGSVSGFMAGSPFNNKTGTLLQSFLFLFWAFILLGVPATNLFRRLSAPVTR